MRMKVDYLVCRLNRSGGRKIIAQHVKLLRERGHEARILTTDSEEEDPWGVPSERVKAFKPSLFHQTDIVVGSRLRDVEAASKLKGPVICHLCQGYEPLELFLCIREEWIPFKYRSSGRWDRFHFLRKKWRRIREIEKIYCLATVKIAVSQAIKDVVENTYGMPCYLVPNGVDQKVFRPRAIPYDFKGTLRLLSVGEITGALKGIEDAIEAVRILKDKGIPVEFTRVSFRPFSEIELRSGLVDRFLVGLNENQMARLYQNSHILIATSFRNGFGLPVIEAMSCGVPSILIVIGGYKFLGFSKEFAYFVPPHSPEAIVEGVLNIKENSAFRENVINYGSEVAKQFTLENMGETLEKTFLGLLRR
jgi:glycosyltransferase involved in cell wall biosynthesis